MKKRFTLKVKPKEKIDFIDITGDIKDFLEKSGVEDGVVHIYSPHTTTAISINENEPNLVKDFKNFIEKVAPLEGGYEHDKYGGEMNARSHISSLFIGQSRSVPFEDGKMMLGTWQSIFFIDLDGEGRGERRVVITIIS